MQSPGDRMTLQGPPREDQRTAWFGARYYELVHSAKVSGPRWRPATGIGLHGEPPAGGESAADAVPGCDYLVSVLREEWEPGGEMARLRLMHMAPKLGPLHATITGLAVPHFIRVSGGTLTPFREVRPVPIALEIRRIGDAQGIQGLAGFALQPASSYTIVISAARLGGPDVIEWSEGQEHAE